MLILAFFDAPQSCMLQCGCGLQARLCYHFFHANFFHAFINVWCLLALAFYYDVEDYELLLAYIIAATIPPVALTAQPAIGFSGVCFALMGIVLYKVARKLYYLAWLVPVVAVGFFLPGVAAFLHLYCFIAGIAVSLLLYTLKRHD